VSSFNDLARAEDVADNLAEGYQAMAAEERRESEALEWSESLIGDAVDDSR
jgi:hypothetical protein